MNHKSDVVLFPTVPHLCMYYLYNQKSVHLKLNTYGYRISHILAIYKPHIYLFYEQIKEMHIANLLYCRS